MKYELLKKLEEAGFPGIELQDGIYNSPSRQDYFAVEPKVLKSPTLEELIDACGKDFISLNLEHWADYNKDKRMYMAEGEYQPLEPHIVTGKSPKEAVANLYLALNK